MARAARTGRRRIEGERLTGHQMYDLSELTDWPHPARSPFPSEDDRRAAWIRHGARLVRQVRLSAFRDAWDRYGPPSGRTGPFPGPSDDATQPADARSRRPSAALAAEAQDRHADDDVDPLYGDQDDVDE